MASEGSVIRAFSANHVVKLTGLSLYQLTYWDETGFFSPKLASKNTRSPYSRIYTFKDVVGLRTIAILRKDYKISLQHLRKVAEHLSQYKDEPWSEIVLYVLGKEVLFQEPETGQIRAVVSGQYVHLPLQDVINEVATEAVKLRERTEPQFGKIERHRLVARNAWVIAGTRIPVKAIQRYAEAGYSTDDILKEYPNLTRRDIEAAIEHGDDLIRQA